MGAVLSADMQLRLHVTQSLEKCATLELLARRGARRPRCWNAKSSSLPAREQLWDALTEPESVAAWFGAEVEWDLRPGGEPVSAEEDGSVRRGRVDAVFPGRHLSFRWWPEDEETTPASRVTYTLDPDEEGTRLTVTEQPVRSPAASAPWPAFRGRMGYRLFRCWARRRLRRPCCRPVANHRWPRRRSTRSSPPWPIPPGGSCSTNLPSGAADRHRVGPGLPDVAPGRRQAPEHPRPRRVGGQ